MNPFIDMFPYTFQLPKLTIIEDMLIARASEIMAFYRLNKSDDVVYFIEYE